jgi:hypothetical protein
MRRLRPLPLLAIVFAVASALLTLAGGTRPLRLLVAQVVGTTALVLLGAEFVRRPALRVVGWIVLGLAAATYLVLARIAVRVLMP